MDLGQMTDDNALTFTTEQMREATGIPNALIQQWTFKEYLPGVGKAVRGKAREWSLMQVLEVAVTYSLSQASNAGVKVSGLAAHKIITTRQGDRPVAVLPYVDTSSGKVEILPTYLFIDGTASRVMPDLAPFDVDQKDGRVMRSFTFLPYHLLFEHVCDVLGVDIAELYYEVLEGAE